jgi:hypothetical protein
MVSCLKQSNITLLQRLSQFMGKKIGIAGAGLGLEPGLLQKICPPNFIVVTGESFVPLSLNTMTIFDVRRSSRFMKVGITTTFESNNRFSNVALVLVGKDFIEIQGKGNGRTRIFIPLNKVERIFPLK